MFSYFAFGAAILVIVFTVAFFYNYTGMAAAKLRAAIELISIWNPNWLMNLQYSPKSRIGEFLNVIIEFSHNPIFFLTYCKNQSIILFACISMAYFCAQIIGI